MNGEESSSIPQSDDQFFKNDEDIPIGVANDVCQGKSDATSSYKPSYSPHVKYDTSWEDDDVKYDVKVMARTQIFDISKSNLDVTEDIPTFYPLKLTVGMSKDDPYIYKGGRAPKVPFIVISTNLEEIKDYAFGGNEVIERLIIPNTVTHIGMGALLGCSKLKHVIFEEGSSLRHIRRWAFEWCTMIEEMKLPESLETLGGYAFVDCKGLKKVTLSPKMTTIDDYTFNGCSSLVTAVEGMNVIQSIGEQAFSRCSSLETINVSQSADIDDTAFLNCNARINLI